VRGSEERSSRAEPRAAPLGSRRIGGADLGFAGSGRQGHCRCYDEEEDALPTKRLQVTTNCRVGQVAGQRSGTRWQ
jgi:hypothetical protein